LARVAEKLSKTLGTAVPASVRGISSKISALAGSYPISAAIAIQSIMSVVELPDDVVDAVEDFLGDDTPENLMVLGEIRKARKQHQERILGDGDPDTTHGVDNDDVDSVSVGLKESIRIYTAGARAAGGEAALDAIREAVLQSNSARQMAKDHIQAMESLR
jgi:hypothetical protein